jgi:hypothetical protein
MIIDWTFFVHMWQLLEQEAAAPRDVVRALLALAPGRSLSTLSEIRTPQG